MYKILRKEALNPTVTRMVIDAPHVARRAKAGQFIILRVDEAGERIPLTIAGADPETGEVTIIFQVVGKTTMLLNAMDEGQQLQDFAGPLGRPSEIEGDSVCIIGGGVGCAIALPTARAFHDEGKRVTAITGFRNRDLVILEDEFRAASDEFHLMSDDGTAGEKGLVTDKLEALIQAGHHFDKVIAIGPIVMMKFVTRTAQKYGIPVVVSMNPIMIDGTGMCGGCRLKVGDEIRFACVDGPDFDGALVDFDEAASRNRAYLDFEQREREEACRLLNQEVR
ncbi:sulfide/dihydroorotate dehydrogenase-like FAD/NAD-binding protein [Faecalibaculum rodentium]|uniref:Ferredoxin-NADP reductase n=1 Tax=Faecalibaculum rodentium TaxID=1702221 RepID=A0A1Q9YLG7_9FIRM|nr:sulfide/dihydroorotate dehydrogenase-like FAD/NAD-binding protein [Faecalibaculum rodentium]OLU45722.1 ferredoxin-NADP reductase [Faecalibaculum rodentium]